MNNFESNSNIKETSEISKESDFALIRDKIFKEAEKIEIKDEDKNENGELLIHPNGHVSNLGKEGEKYWKIARTSTFKKWFGDWQSLSEKDLENWHTYKDLKQVEENLEYTRWLYSGKPWKIENTDLNTDEKYQERLQNELNKISKLTAELGNNGFNIHKMNTISKAIDENGEPILLARATEHTPDKNGLFNIDEENQVGIFLGNQVEANYHYKAHNNEVNKKKLFYCFTNIKDYKLYDQKPDYWGWRDSKRKGLENDRRKEEFEKLKQKYDGLIVKNFKDLKSKSDNYIDILVFNPENVLVIDTK